MKTTTDKGKTTMINGHTLNAEMVEKVISKLEKAGRTVHTAAYNVRLSGGFNSATDCADTFIAKIWNMGLVK